ncbi:hypothetical protein RFI_06036 [Reticulomyxa filosa]|uniref:NLE domain-containing protein n=1 Tax=Reticulomyxa filosa TaxID=46433 RepID=X6NXP7_RETFI|nr:hypothetical protein RFI_06036 [Reticulomyxa filosa]|eukprot:ETO31085.1 hypothetical protein RFI_06036 [Reticulomyxa filosa]
MADSETNAEESIFSANKRLKLSVHDNTRDIFLNQQLSHVQSASDVIKAKQNSNHPRLSRSVIQSKSSVTLPNPMYKQQLKAGDIGVAQANKKKKKKSLKKSVKRVLVQFQKRGGEKTGNPIDIPVGFTVDKLELLINTLLKQTDEPVPYAFYYQPSLDSSDQSTGTYTYIYI